MPSWNVQKQCPVIHGSIKMFASKTQPKVACLHVSQLRNLDICSCLRRLITTDKALLKRRWCLVWIIAWAQPEVRENSFMKTWYFITGGKGIRMNQDLKGYLKKKKTKTWSLVLPQASSSSTTLCPRCLKCFKAATWMKRGNCQYWLQTNRLKHTLKMVCPGCSIQHCCNPKNLFHHLVNPYTTWHNHPCLGEAVFVSYVLVEIFAQKDHRQDYQGVRVLAHS